MFGQNNNNNTGQPVSTQPVNPGLLGIDDEDNASLEPVTPPFDNSGAFEPVAPPSVGATTSSSDDTSQLTNQTASVSDDPQRTTPSSTPPVSDDSASSATDNLNEVESNNEQSNINNLTSPESPQVALPSTNSLSDSDDLIDIKRQALKELSPLINHLDQSSEEKFKTTMMMIQASDDKSLIPRAFESAKSITSEKERAQALLDIVNEINYFTHKTED